MLSKQLNQVFKYIIFRRQPTPVERFQGFKLFIFG